jgi:ubiquinone biosynthesis monooxygenase Coq7
MSMDGAVGPRRTNEGWQPGDPTPREFVERAIRVDHAGEVGAVRIYEGQLAALRWRGQGNSPVARRIEHMLAQETAHKRVFDELIAERRVRPTILSPVWSVAGFALGAATAVLGDAAAMACTVAVEETIDEHYAAQRDRLGDDEAALRGTVERFRQDEVAHRDEALASGAEKAPAYDLLTTAIRGGSRLAIWLSTRV